MMAAPPHAMLTNMCHRLKSRSSREAYSPDCTKTQMARPTALAITNAPANRPSPTMSHRQVSRMPAPEALCLIALLPPYEDSSPGHHRRVRQGTQAYKEATVILSPPGAGA